MELRLLESFSWRCGLYSTIPFNGKLKRVLARAFKLALWHLVAGISRTNKQVGNNCCLRSQMSISNELLLITSEHTDTHTHTFQLDGEHACQLASKLVQN